MLGHLILVACGYKLECWSRHLSAGSCGLSTSLEPHCCAPSLYAQVLVFYAQVLVVCVLRSFLSSTRPASSSASSACLPVNQPPIEWRLVPPLPPPGCLCSTQYFVQAYNWCAISGTRSRKCYFAFFHPHNEKEGCLRARRKRKKSCRPVFSFALIGLHRRKWFRALLSQFTPGRSSKEHVHQDIHWVQI